MNKKYTIIICVVAVLLAVVGAVIIISFSKNAIGSGHESTVNSSSQIIGESIEPDGSGIYTNEDTYKPRDTETYEPEENIDNITDDNATPSENQNDSLHTDPLEDDTTTKGDNVTVDNLNSTPDTTEVSNNTSTTNAKTNEQTDKTHQTNKQTSAPTDKTSSLDKDDPSETGPDTSLTYSEYIKMTAADQQVYFESFATIEDYFKWYNTAKKQYEDEQNRIDFDGTLDIGDLFGGNK